MSATRYKVAVTGASGFIGRYVVEALLRRNVEITAVTRDARRLSNLPNPVHIVEMDLSDPGVHALARLGTPDIVIHLAWGGLPNYMSLDHFEIELPAQYKFLKTLVAEGLSSVLVSGTCFEYGNQSGPLQEDLNCHPTTPYGFAKDILRRQMQFLKCKTPFELTWLRLFYVFGDGQGKRSLWSQVESALNRGDKRFPMSGGEQLRDFLPVAELADALVRLALFSRDVGVVNLCSGIPRSVRTIVEEWIRASGKQMDLELGHYPYLDYEPMAFWGDQEKLSMIMSRHDDAHAL